MKAFKIAQPRSLEQVTSLMTDAPGKHALMAGGTDLLDELKSGVASPEIVIDLQAVSDLAYIRKTASAVEIGAMTTVAALAEHDFIRSEYPGLQQAALSLATPQLRNIGTVGGNLCQRPRCWYYRDPQISCRKKGGSRCFARRGRNRYHAVVGGGLCFIVFPSDLAPSLISLGAEIIVDSSRGQRVLPLEELYVLPRANIRKENALADDEIIHMIRLPLLPDTAKNTYFKLKERGTWDFAVVSAAVSGTLSGNTFRDVRVVCGGIAPIPWRLVKTESAVTGKPLTEELIKNAVREDLAAANPLEENDYKIELLQAAVSRAVLSLIA